MKIELSTVEIKALSAAIAEEALKTLAPRLEALERALIQRPLALPEPKGKVNQAISPAKPAKFRRDMLRRGDLQEITGLSSSTISRLESKGQFPARVKLSAKRVGWPLAEVEKWVEERQFA